jgi:hypothetical protein
MEAITNHIKTDLFPLFSSNQSQCGHQFVSVLGEKNSEKNRHIKKVELKVKTKLKIK